MKKILILTILITSFDLSFGASHPVAAEATAEQKRKAALQHEGAATEQHGEIAIPESFTKAGLSLEDLKFFNSQMQSYPVDLDRVMPIRNKLVAALSGVFRTSNHKEFEDILKFAYNNQIFKGIYGDFILEQLIYTIIKLRLYNSEFLNLNDEFLKLFVKYNLIDKIIQYMESYFQQQYPGLYDPKLAKENYDKIINFKKEYEEYLKYKKDHETKFSEELKKHLVPGLPELTSSFHELTFDEYLDLKNKK